MRRFDYEEHYDVVSQEAVIIFDAERYTKEGALLKAIQLGILVKVLGNYTSDSDVREGWCKWQVRNVYDGSRWVNTSCYAYIDTTKKPEGGGWFRVWIVEGRTEK